jgi:hypothetical protein
MLTGLISKLSGYIRCVIAVFVLAVVAVPAYAAWTYNASDLCDANCIQEHLDRLGAMKGTNILKATQMGVVTQPSAVYTGTFPTVFLETPAFMYGYTTNTMVFTNTLMQVTSNQFIIGIAGTNFNWIAVGRIK